MRFHPTIAANGKHLRRVAALLFALADLAERAAGSSRAVCLLVLWLIRPSEATARDLVESLAPGAACLPAPEPLRSHDGAAEALRLAQNFSFLAATLTALAEHCFAALPTTPANRPPAGLVAAPVIRPDRRRAARQFLARGPPMHLARDREPVSGQRHATKQRAKAPRANLKNREDRDTLRLAFRARLTHSVSDGP